jgi:hypothetical protein
MQIISRGKIRRVEFTEVRAYVSLRLLVALKYHEAGKPQAVRLYEPTQVAAVGAYYVLCVT